MRDELLQYYERELGWLRRMGGEFAQRYPKVAGRLQLESTKCDDPHVERLLEAFAFLAARVHLHIDDDFPEVSQRLLDIVYPHYVRPIPSMSVVEVRLDPEQGKTPTGFHIERDSLLYSRPVDGVPCKFKTCYDTTLWPLGVASAQWLTPDRLRPAVRAGDAIAALRLELRCFEGLTFAKLGLETLRLHLHGEGNLTSALYELLDNHCTSIIVRETGGGPSAKSITLPASALQPVGFDPDQGVLPFNQRSFNGHRLLQEYFAFPEKFLFFDLAGFDRVRAAGLGESVEVICLVNSYERTDWRPMLEAGVSAATIKLGCTPVVNLFPHTAEPILLTERRHEYQLVPDARRRLTTEVFAVESVNAAGGPGGSGADRQITQFQPLYGHRHVVSDSGLFWVARRQRSAWRSDEGTDVFLSFVDLTGRAVHPELDAITVRLTCFNSDLPSRLPFGNETGDFELEGGGPVRAVVALVKPTHVVQPPLAGGTLWRLVSLLSLNYLSLSEGGVDALRELLLLHDFSDSASARKQIAGVTSIKTAPAFARIATEHGLSFARGRRVELELDEEQFAGAGIYLFASVLERFLALYASMNSFSVLSARAPQRRSVLREWAPRAGWKALL